jgi:hypothetical protein
MEANGALVRSIPFGFHMDAEGARMAITVRMGNGSM